MVQEGVRFYKKDKSRKMIVLQDRGAAMDFCVDFGLVL